MAVSDRVSLSGFLGNAECFALVRQHRWPGGVRCPGCGSGMVIRDGHDETQPHRQRYGCKACTERFDDLAGTVLAGHHQRLRVRVPCLYFMGLNLSNRQIASEAGLCASDVQATTEQLRDGLVQGTQGSAEWRGSDCWVSVVAGHKGPPEGVAKRGGRVGAAGWQGRRAGARRRRTGRPSRA